jgi:hypothetical protein
LLQVLGSVTALCCVDKKGILSWPNPTADRVFFLTSKEKESEFDDSEDDSDNEMDDEGIMEEEKNKKDNQMKGKNDEKISKDSEKQTIKHGNLEF